MHSKTADPGGWEVKGSGSAQWRVNCGCYLALGEQQRGSPLYHSTDAEGGWHCLAASGEENAVLPNHAHRIIESFRLEKTLKITKSNHQSNTAKSTTKPCS